MYFNMFCIVQLWHLREHGTRAYMVVAIEKGHGSYRDCKVMVQGTCPHEGLQEQGCTLKETQTGVPSIQGP